MDVFFQNMIVVEKKSSVQWYLQDLCDISLDLEHANMVYQKINGII